MIHSSRHKHGFTLIELSIVLVIIGLIIGGILVGQDMITQAATRATIAQIEKYNSAVNTFVAKYGGYPGDLFYTQARQFGFTSGNGSAGQRDGNGLLQNALTLSGSQYAVCCTSGETLWFWDDLSYANMIDGGFNYTSTGGSTITSTTSPALNAFIPVAKIGNGNYLNVYSQNGLNYFDVAAVTSLDNNGAVRGNTGLTPQQAYNIDKKIDDGFPQSGNVTAQYQAWNVVQTVTAWSEGGGVNGPSDTTATTQSLATCYDNGGAGGATQQYSLGSSAKGGITPNCGISFKMQGAAR